MITLLCSLAFPASALTAEELIKSYQYQQNTSKGWEDRSTSFSVSYRPYGLRFVYDFNDVKSDGTTLVIQTLEVSNAADGGLATNWQYRPTSVEIPDIFGTMHSYSVSGTSGSTSVVSDPNGNNPDFTLYWETTGEQSEYIQRFTMTLAFPNGYKFDESIYINLMLNWYSNPSTVVIYTSDPVVVKTEGQATITDIKQAIDDASDKITASLDKNSKEIQDVIKGQPIDETPNEELGNSFDDYQSKEDELLNSVFNGSYTDPDTGEEINIDMNGNIFDQIQSFFGEMYQNFIGVVAYGTQIFRFVLQFFINGFGILLIFPLTLGLVGSIIGRS